MTLACFNIFMVFYEKNYVFNIRLFLILVTILGAALNEAKKTQRRICCRGFDKNAVL